MVQKSGYPVEVGSLSRYLQCFIHPRWCRISSINSNYCPYHPCQAIFTHIWLILMVNVVYKHTIHGSYRIGLYQGENYPVYELWHISSSYLSICPKMFGKIQLGAITSWWLSHPFEKNMHHHVLNSLIRILECSLKPLT